MDCRNQRLNRVNFKKRDNQRETAIREKHSIKRINQSFLAIFGEKIDVCELNLKEKMSLIKEKRNFPQKLKKYWKENPIVGVEA